MTSKRLQEELQEVERLAEKKSMRAQQWQALYGMVKEIFETVAFILLIFFILRAIMQNYRIEGSSMEPNFHTAQFIWVNKMPYFHIDLNAPLRLLPGKKDLEGNYIYPFEHPRRGDVVVFEEETDRLIKRVIGVEGDQVEIKDGGVYVNGQQLNERYITVSTNCLGDPSNCNLVVPPHHVYVLGDNRPNSKDSRSLGPINLNQVTGKAWLSYWPREYWGEIPDPDYN